MNDMTERPRGAKEVPPDAMRGGRNEPAAGNGGEEPNVNSRDYHYKLLYEIDAHGDKIKELVFREPTGNDIVRYGSPVRLDLSLNELTMETQMSNLASVPPSTIKQLRAKDWQTISFELCGRFFVPALGQRD